MIVDIVAFHILYFNLFRNRFPHELAESVHRSRMIYTLDMSPIVE